MSTQQAQLSGKGRPRGPSPGCSYRTGSLTSPKSRPGEGEGKEGAPPQERPRLTGVLVGQGDEGAGDVPPPVEAHHLGLHVPVGRLQQQGGV